MQTSGALCREIVDFIFGCHRPPCARLRTGRTIQYSRDGNDWAEKLRRTGCPAFAGHDDVFAARLCNLNPAR